ncbi:MAG: DMT family protein [Bacteroides sp.]|nr:DMT family protein [Bacteroides sp.]
MDSRIATILLLIVSNIFMTFAWYGHLKLSDAGISTNWPLYLVILFSWLLALAEYSFMVPANRIGYTGNGGPFTLMQLKVIQEAVTLTIFTIIVTIIFKGETIRWNHLIAFLLLIAAVYFAFLPAPIKTPPQNTEQPS